MAAVKALPRHTDKPQHHRALHHSEVAAALQKVRASKASTASKLGIELLLLAAHIEASVEEARPLAAAPGRLPDDPGRGGGDA